MLVRSCAHGWLEDRVVALSIGLVVLGLMFGG